MSEPKGYAMKKSDVVQHILRTCSTSPIEKAHAFAPSNIALCKYWGKRNTELNLPITSSLSVSLGKKGSYISIEFAPEDKFILNGQVLNPFSIFSKRLTEFLNLFRENYFFRCEMTSNIPIAAGLASSASGFAALVLALNHLLGWQLPAKDLSILARLGSGSACRSIWPGFVEWQQGEDENGMDSYGFMMNTTWPELCIGLYILQSNEKSLSSREAMNRTVETSALYSAWPDKVREDLHILKEAILSKDLHALGKTAESNALAMHATMLSAWPPIQYSLPQTLSTMQKIWDLRSGGLEVYFTQDAGPNLKLLFLEKDKRIIQSYFPALEIIQPFSNFAL